jgi:UDP:flavonoid glycosyltransferase YjiC (YdhE family)
MTVVLLPNAGFLSETTRMLAVYRELEKLGTPAVLASHGGTYEGVLREAGVPWERIPPTQTSEDCTRLLELLNNPFRGHLYSRKQLRKIVENEVSFFRQVDARVVVSGFTLSASLSARALSIPLVVTHLASWIPPVLERGRFGVSEFFDSSFPISILPDRLQARLVAWLFPRVRKHAGVFKQVAKDLDIEPVRGLFDLMLGDLVFVTDVPEILGIPEEDLEAWRPRSACYRPDLRFSYVGAIYARVFGKVPEEVTRFLRSTKPTVYVAMASTRSEYMQAVLDTIETMDVRAVIVTTVHGDELEPKGDVLLYDFLPSHEVMPLCDAAIIHGGQGTIQTAIASGTPFVGIPLQPEQNVNLKIIEHRGGSRTVSLKALRKGDLRSRLEEVLGDESFRKSMANLKDFQAQQNGPAETAKRLTMLHAV